ncbi:uncharacterized protein LACBIDRAFT_329887 [Laccaria bicolor S238N-H82]|uniref:Predicted protein n=1 Tax=Laccaria bicolor (strain S238N-H82 / ATCC MYA-4686) TaxID=486041 RepID=B0DJJ7_LACBS|nr:uncharacterized protein LACBIDRAFT_329887 [Laccaria bicolor S238N-H82]EDR05131.1 predicted protein [Laccaria bicolor S238N-H82]|eukprot:XP_001884096.1 predicted protein [Laccaria bicolor S238N-H82]
MPWFQNLKGGEKAMSRQRGWRAHPGCREVVLRGGSGLDGVGCSSALDLHVERIKRPKHTTTRDLERETPTVVQFWYARSATRCVLLWHSTAPPRPTQQTPQTLRSSITYLAFQIHLQPELRSYSTEYTCPVTLDLSNFRSFVLAIPPQEFESGVDDGEPVQTLCPSQPEKVWSALSLMAATSTRHDSSKRRSLRRTVGRTKSVVGGGLWNGKCESRLSLVVGFIEKEWANVAG